MEKQIMELYNSGLSPLKISQIVNKGRRDIYRILNKNNIFLKKLVVEKKCDICNNTVSTRRNRCDTCNTKIRRYRAKKAAVEYLGGKCVKCGWVGNISAFDFHHLDSNIKNFSPSAVELANKSWNEVKAELDKCELLCAICHRLEHNDYGNEKLLEIANKNDKELIFKK